MAVYNVHGGHNSKAPGAAKYLNEVTEDRRVKNKVIALLRAQGHTVYDCTDDSGSTQSKNLANIVAKCNKHKVALDISIHLNAGGGTGVEVYYYPSSSTGKAKAKVVSSKVAKALGLRNRGAKASSSLYVLRRTKAPAILVECCFVDSKTDKKKWNVDKCAKAIVEGVTGKAVSSSGGSSSSSSSSKVPFLVKVKVSDLTIRSGAGIKYKAVGHIRDKGTYTITQVKYNGSTPWGKLKSGAGWISIHSAYVNRL